MPQKENLHEILNIKPQKLHRTLWLMAILIVVIFITYLYGTGYFVKGFVNYFRNAEDKKNFIVFSCSVFIGVIGGILSSIIYRNAYHKANKKDERNKIKQILNLANPTLTTDFFEHLKIYNKRYCQDYLIDASLDKHAASDDVFVCNVKYEYKKVLKSRDLLFQFIRVKNDKDVDKLKSDSDQYFKYEFFYTLDERSVKNIKNSDYKLLHLIIKSSNEDDAKPIELKKRVFDNKIEFYARIPDEVDIKGKLIDIMFEVEYPIEKESYLFFTIELPTNCVKCSFDYSKIKDYIEVHPFDVLSSHKGPTALHQKGATRFIFIKNNWILPRSSFAFIWYKK